MAKVQTLLVPPIIEAVLDIDCVQSPAFDIRRIQNPSRKALAKTYPKLRPIFVQNHRLEATPDEQMKYSVEGRIQGFQFVNRDEKQIVQFRAQGFSFNRLAPYTSLDDYMPQIKKMWLQYSKLVSPVQIRSIRLRYINRILLPLIDGRVNIDDYILNGPRLADSKRLVLTGFLDQYAAIDKLSGHQINSVLTLQPADNDKLPIIFDNGAVSIKSGDVGDWAWIRTTILELRELKNHIFSKTVTKKCLNLFQ